MQVIVFVCTGNTCRSPMAERLCKKMLAERIGCEVAELPERGYKVLSAGLAAVSGVSATRQAQAVMQEMGVDLSDHVSQPVTAQLLLDADLRVAMTSGHAERIQQQYAGDLTLRPLCGYNRDVADPIGGDLNVYRACAQTIEHYLRPLVAELYPG